MIEGVTLTSPTWLALIAYAKAEIDKCRDSLESDQTPERTMELRERAKLMRELINHGSPPPIAEKIEPKEDYFLR